MSNVPTAPADPMFWMHHAEIDRIWAIWSTSRNGAGKKPTLTGSNTILDPWSESYKNILDTKDGDYVYSYDRMKL